MKGNFAIVHVCEALASGILKVVPALANETATQGIPTVVVHGRRPETPAELTDVFDARVRTVAVPGWGDRSPRGVLTGTARAAAILRRELSRYEGGVLHLHSTHAGLVGRVVPAAGWSRFYTPQGYAFLNESHPALVRWLTLGAETLLARRGHTLACSRAEGAEAARLLGRDGVSVVQNGVDSASPPPLVHGPQEGFVVASVGRAVYQRRPDLFAEMTAILRPGLAADFRWIGDGPHGELLARAGVEVSGWLPQAEAEAALAHVDVLVHFAAFEGLPLSLLEAMTTGRAIVASDLPVISEVLDDAGILVGSPEEAADAVRRLYASEGLRAELAGRAQERVRRLFTRRTMVERTLAAYDLAGSARGSRRA